MGTKRTAYRPGDKGQAIKGNEQAKTGLKRTCPLWTLLQQHSWRIVPPSAIKTRTITRKMLAAT